MSNPDIANGVELGPNRRYKLDQLIGSGSLNDYWKGFDTILERTVIIKFVRTNPDFDEGLDLDRKWMFLRDATMLAQLEHPNVLPVYDLGEHDGHILYNVVRDVQGTSLLQGVTQGRSCQSLSSIIQLASRLGAAIDYIHQKGIVHGDLNPNNILIGTQDQPYIANFTVAATRKLAPTATVGTPGFVAPEIIRGGGETATKLCDIYSFGVILFFCFSGGQWPPNASLEEVVPIPFVREYKPDFPVTIDVILRRATHSEPSHRFQSALEIVNDLQRALYSKPKLSTIGRIFISYASSDKQAVHEIAEEMRQVGLSVWIDDHTGIPTGTTWAEQIQSGLDECDSLLLMVTEASMKSDYVTHEWSYFMGSKKPVYPFVISGDALPPNVHPRLEHFQFEFGSSADTLANVSRIIDMLSSR